MDAMTLKPNIIRLLRSFLDTGIAGIKANFIQDSGITAQEKREWQENRFVTHTTEGRNCEVKIRGV